MRPSPNQSSLSSSRKTVTFAEKVKARLTTHIQNFSLEERKSYWYTPDEYKRIRGDISVAVQLIEMEIDISSSPEFCARGLETQVIDGARRRAEKKRRAWKALSLEQQSQRQRGINNAQALADVYAAEVQECRVTAHARGLADQTHRQLALAALRAADGVSFRRLTTKWEQLASAISMEGSKKATVVQTIRHRHLSTQAA